MKLQTTLLAAAVALMPVLGSAASPVYTYLEMNYVASDQDGDGYGFNGSLALTKNVHFFGGYNIIRDTKGGFFQEERSAYNFGLGYNYALRPSLDLVARASFIHSKCRSPDASEGYDNCYDAAADNYFPTVHKSSYGLEGQIRWMATDRVEINGGVMRNNGFGNFDANTFLEAGIRYDVIPHVSLGANVMFADSSSGFWTVGARYSFGGGSGSSMRNPFDSLSDSSK